MSLTRWKRIPLSPASFPAIHRHLVVDSTLEMKRAAAPRLNRVTDPQNDHDRKHSRACSPGQLPDSFHLFLAADGRFAQNRKSDSHRPVPY